MASNLLRKLWVLAFYWPLALNASDRIQTELPIYDLRQMVMRYSPSAAGRATIGRVQNNQFIPVETYSVGGLGTTNCEALLDMAQAFPLAGMLAAKYIDQETHDALVHSAHYLRPDQVAFFRVLSYLSADEFGQYRPIIKDNQLGAAPPRSRQDMQSVAVTVGTSFLVAGFRHTDKGVEKAAMPWTKDPSFADAAPGILAEMDGLNFEMGRAMQVVPGTLDLNINATLITIAHEMAIARGDFSKARVFVHSFKRANTIHYRRKVPSLKVVAVDPKNPENVVLATTLAELFSKERPWNYSSAIQSLVAVNPQVLTVPKVWNFLTALRSSGAAIFDYVNSEGERGPHPILLRLPSYLFSSIVSAHTAKMGITEQKDANAIVSVLQNGKFLTEDSDMADHVDPVSLKTAAIFEHSKNVVTLTDLDPKESKADPNYELRVLFAGVMQYGEILRWADRSGVNGARYALVTSDPDVAAKIEKLGPSEQRSDKFQVDWRLSNNPKGATFNFMQATAHSFIFTFADMQRLASAHPDLFRQIQENPPLRFGFFHRQGLLGRPNGF